MDGFSHSVRRQTTACNDVGPTCELRFAVDDTLMRLLYIDGTDAAEEGVWVSVTTGAELTYFNWDHDEPSGGSIQNCVVINRNSGLWLDFPCSTYLSIACQSESKSNFKHFSNCNEVDC